MTIFKKSTKRICFPTIYLNCSMNNIIGGLLNVQGHSMFIISSGQLKFRGTNKNSKIALQQIINILGNSLLKKGFDKTHIKVRGFNPGRISIIKNLVRLGIQVVQIIDDNNLAFNGCRMKRKRL